MAVNASPNILFKTSELPNSAASAPSGRNEDAALSIAARAAPLKPSPCIIEEVPEANAAPIPLAIAVGSDDNIEEAAKALPKPAVNPPIITPLTT